MNNNNNFYKVDHHYNKPNPGTFIPSQHLSTTSKTNNRSSKIGALIDKFQNPQRTSHEPSVASSSVSYHEKISKILTNWQQLQEEKKTYQKQQQQQQQQQQNEFDQIMEEVLEYQLKELECEEEKQSKLIEQVIEEQLGQEHQNKLTNNCTEGHLEQLRQFDELERALEECNTFEKDPQLNKKKISKGNKLGHRKQQTIMDLDTWKQKHDMYLKNIMNKGNQMKMNKIIYFLEICHRTKKYYNQSSKK